MRLQIQILLCHLLILAAFRSTHLAEGTLMSSNVFPVVYILLILLIYLYPNLLKTHVIFKYYLSVCSNFLCVVGKC